MAIETFANNARSQLNGAIDNVVTSLDVDDGSVFPQTGQFRIKIENEILLVTAVATNTLTVVRGQESTTAASHADNLPVTHVITSGALSKFKEDTRNPDVISPTQITASQNNYNPTSFSGAGVVRLDSDAQWNITGFDATAAIVLKELINVGSFNLVLKHEDTNSTAANRISTPGGVDRPLASGESLEIYYDSTTARWRVLNEYERNATPLSPAQIVANQNDYNPTGFSKAGVVRLDSDASRNITGFDAGAIVSRKELVNVGSFDIVLKHQDAASSAANRIITPESVDRVLAPGESLEVYYDSTTTRWRVLNEYGRNAVALTPAQITTNQNDYNPTGFSKADVVRLDSDASRNLTGFDAGAIVTRKELINVGSFDIVLKHQDAGSSAANRIITPEGVDRVLATGESLEVYYDSTTSRWRILNEYTRNVTPLSPSQITANQNDYNPTGFSRAGVLRLDSDASRDITGFDAGAIVYRKQLVNVGSFNLVLKHQDAGSSAANRIITPEGVDRVLAPGESVEIYYDATTTRWRVLNEYARNPVVISPAQITADQNDYNPSGFSSSGIVRLDTDASRNITGFDAGAIVYVKKIINVGANNVVLQHQNAGSAAANRILVAAGSDLTLTPNQSTDIYYDSTTARWRTV